MATKIINCALECILNGVAKTVTSKTALRIFENV